MKKKPPLVLLCLLAAALSAADTRSIRIRAFKPALEIGRAKDAPWAFADTATPILDSDRLRVSRGGSALVEMAGGLKLYLGDQTLVRLEIRNDPRQKIALNHITLYQGRLYAITPEESVVNARHQILTPSALVTLRSGAGAGVASDPEINSTRITVVNGTAAVRNTQYPDMVYVPSGKTLFADLGQEPGTAAPSDSAALASLTFINALSKNALAKEIDKDRVKREQAKALLAGSGGNRLLLCRFRNASDYNGLWDIEIGMARIMADAVRKETGLSVDVLNSPLSDALLDSLKGKTGLLLTGVIDTFDIIKDARSGPGQDELQLYLACGFSITVTLVSPADRRTLTEIIGREEGKEKETAGADFKTLVNRPFSFADPVFRESLAGRSLSKIALRSAVHIRTYLGL